MPWCEPCERFWNPRSLTTDGACPSCGATVDAPAGSESATSTTPQRVPWHFWVAITAAAIYLGWRAIQGIALLF